MSTSIKKGILGLLLFGSLSISAEIGLSFKICYELLPETRKIEYIYSKEEIEGLVKLVETPQEAFDVIDKIAKIQFSENHDDEKFSGERWCSLRETYSLGTGDCDDGAIAFCALLSNNPQYKTWFIWLVPPEDSDIPGHAMAIYEDQGKYGYASFNHISFMGSFNVFQPAVYDSLDEAVKNFHRGNYKKYSKIQFDEDTLKFGRALQIDSDDLEWILIK